MNVREALTRALEAIEDGDLYYASEIIRAVVEHITYNATVAT